jgi:hypothetical protein
MKPDPALHALPARLREERRAFLLAARRHGLTVAVLGLTGGFLHDRQALAQTAADEERKQKAAKVTMLFATEYKIEDYVKYPIMQAKYKDNIETQSKGEIYCKLHPAGQLGIGAALAQKIQAGTVHGGAVSLSNFSPSRRWWTSSTSPTGAATTSALPTWSPARPGTTRSRPRSWPRATGRCSTSRSTRAPSPAARASRSSRRRPTCRA